MKEKSKLTEQVEECVSQNSLGEGAPENGSQSIPPREIGLGKSPKLSLNQSQSLQLRQSMLDQTIQISQYLHKLKKAALPNIYLNTHNINQLIKMKSERLAAIRASFDRSRSTYYCFGNQLFDHFKKDQKLKVLAVTWNLKGGCPQQDISSLFSTKTVLHHLIVVSTQECQRSIPMSFFVQSKEKWEQQLRSAIGEEYILVESVVMNAMHMALFCHSSLMHEIKNCTSNQKGVGLFNFVGNKGGLVIGLQIMGKNFAFVNCHLASGQNKVDKRNKDQQKISQMKVNKSKFQSLIEQHDYVIWMGDMNYRINENQESVFSMIQSNDYLKLLLLDQLLQ